MESKRKGSSKSKLLMSFHGGAEPKTVEFMASSSKGPSPAAVGFIIVKQVFPPHQKPKVAFVVPGRNPKLESFYGAAGEDDAVDAKAARYISTVQERFRLELVNSECNNFHDMRLSS